MSHDFDDGGAAFLSLNSVPPESWHMIWPGLTAAEADIITTHFRDAGYVYTFSFTDKLSVVQTGVRYAEQGGYSRTHERNRSWSVTVEVLLVKFP